MTARQAQYLSFIDRYTTRHGVAPSFEDIGAHFGVSPPTVNSMIQRLEGAGLLSRVPGAARTLRVEVPAGQLPEGEFRRRGKAKSGRATTTAGTPVAAADVAAAVAAGLLDVLIPKAIEAGMSDAAAVNLILKAAEGARRAAERAGLGRAEATELTQRIRAQAARWTEEGRGVSVPRRTWQPKATGRGRRRKT